MRSVVFHTPDDVELVDISIPEPGPNEALIRIEASAICGSELHAPDGTNPGHEGVGIVESIPDGTDFEPGEHVGISAVTGCGRCAFCVRGEQIYCPQVTVTGALHADYAIVPVAALRKLPADITSAEAVLLTGDACGVPIRALRKVPHNPGARIAVVGLGPVGIAHVLVRRHQGADVIGIEPSLYRRQLALRLGAAAVYEPGEDIGDSPEMVIECTGIPACVQQSFHLVAPGGTVLQSGWCRTLEMDAAAVVLIKEVVYTGTWYYTDVDYPLMIDLYKRGLPVADMMTHEFTGDETAEAYRRFISKESGKIVLKWT